MYSGIEVSALDRHLSPYQGTLYLFHGETSRLRSAMQEIVYQAALQGQVKVIVGGNHISFDRLGLALGDKLGNIYQILDNILVSRAETCYQMVDVLVNLEPVSTPIVILDMLAPFQEKDLTLEEVTLQLKKCIRRLQQLNEEAPILIAVNCPPNRAPLLSLLEVHSDQRFYFQELPDDATPVQVPLWPS